MSNVAMVDQGLMLASGESNEIYVLPTELKPYKLGESPIGASIEGLFTDLQILKAAQPSGVRLLCGRGSLE